MENWHIKVSSALMRNKNAKIKSDLKFTIAEKKLQFQFFYENYQLKQETD